MSIKVITDVWELDLPSSEKIVLLAYADHAAPDGTSIFPSMALMARKTGHSERSIQRITRSLEGKGYLFADGTGPRGTKRWRLRTETDNLAPMECVVESGPGGGDKMSPEKAAGATSTSQEGDRMSPVKATGATSEARLGDKMSPLTSAGVTSATPGGDTRREEGVTPVSPEPSLTVIEPSTRAVLEKADIDNVNAQVSAMVALSRRPTYTNREKIPEPYLPYADVYHELTGQVPTKRALHDWLMEFSVWQSEGIGPEHVRQAHKEAAGRFTITRPGSLTRTAAALKARPSAPTRKSRDPEWHKRADAILQYRLAEGRRRAAEYYKSQGMPFEDPEAIRPLISDVPRLMAGGPEADPQAGTPVPEAIRERINALVKSKSVPR